MRGVSTPALEPDVKEIRTSQNGARRNLEVIDPETRDGEIFARTYDILEYPTIIALGNDGQVQNSWRGTTLPTIGEVSYYATQD